MADSKMLTVLSIDSGGIKGIIPAVMLEHLEAQLQSIDGSNATIAEYFDIIAGSGTGGLITAMITAPTRNGRPLYSPKEITPIFKEQFPLILAPQPRDCRGIPVYDQGKPVDELAKSIFLNIPLSNTLTDVVIPSYETKALRPLIFSNELAKTNTTLDALLSDIVTSGSAAYPWVKAYNFTNRGQTFDTVDGSVPAPNPALIAITELIRKQKGTPVKFDSVLLVSLGTCGASATSNAGWTSPQINGMTDQLNLMNNARSMIGKFTSVVNAYTIDYQLETIYQAYSASDNYLRIFENGLTRDMDEVDKATPANLNNIEAYARALLNRPVTRTGSNPYGDRVPVGNETNAQALTRFAQKLSANKKARSTT